MWLLPGRRPAIYSGCRRGCRRSYFCEINLGANDGSEADRIGARIFQGGSCSVPVVDEGCTEHCSRSAWVRLHTGIIFPIQKTELNFGFCHSYLHSCSSNWFNPGRRPPSSDPSLPGFISVDPATGAATVVNPTAPTFGIVCCEVAFNPATHTMFFYTSRSALLEVDTRTGISHTITAARPNPIVFDPGTGKNLGDPNSSVASAGTAEGNPINAGTGNKYQPQADFVGGSATGLSLTRTYNSADTSVSAFGSNWHSTWHRG